jgi:hypothetical protein
MKKHTKLKQAILTTFTGIECKNEHEILETLQKRFGVPLKRARENFNVAVKQGYLDYCYCSECPVFNSIYNKVLECDPDDILGLTLLKCNTSMLPESEKWLRKAKRQDLQIQVLIESGMDELDAQIAVLV